VRRFIIGLDKRMLAAETRLPHLLQAQGDLESSLGGG
jgi:hypothetical protein